MPNDLTMEEVADNLRKGKGSIKLATKGLDGKEKEIAVWGGYELDGLYQFVGAVSCPAHDKMKILQN